MQDGETLSATVRLGAEAHAYRPCGRSAQLVSGRLCRAFALVRGDGSLVAWGDRVACGQCPEAAEGLSAAREVQ